MKKPSQNNQDRDILVSPVEPTLRKLHTSVHWLGARLGVLVTPVEPTPGKLNTSVQWTQQLRQNLYTGWTDARYWWTSVQLSRELVFQQLHSPVKPTLHRLITSVDWGSRWSITASWKMHSPVKPVMTKSWASDQPTLRVFVSLFPTASLGCVGYIYATPRLIWECWRPRKYTRAQDHLQPP